MRISDWSSDVCSSDLVTMADDLVSQASALGETCRAELLRVVRSGDRAQRTRAREILEADLDRALTAAIADFGAGSRAIADFANRLEPLILDLDRKSTRLNSSH